MKNERAVSGDNSPPSPLDDALAPFSDAIAEAEAWADGEPITTQGQMDDVDKLIKSLKECKRDVTAAEELEAAPLYDVWKAKKAEYKPTLDDLDLLVKSLVKSVGPFKQKLLEEKRQAEREAWDKANAAKIAADKAAKAAQGIEQERAAQQAQEAALEADKQARQASKDKPKGLRKVHKFVVEDFAAAWGSIPQGVKMLIIEDWVSKNHKAVDIAGVRQWIEKESF